MIGEFKQTKIQVLAELTKLRQICCDPSLIYEDYQKDSAKLDMCMELIENAVNGGHKILLFSQFTTMLERIQSRLDKAKIGYYTLTGATDKGRRRRLVEKFNADETPVFCISLKAGGTGLNLTSADIVIHYDPWWNEAVQNRGNGQGASHWAEKGCHGIPSAHKGNDRGADYGSAGKEKRIIR